MNTTTEIHGVQVEPMRWQPRKQDRVYHTHKHFLASEWQSEWRNAEPQEAGAPTHFVAEAAKTGVALREWAHSSLDGRWWRGDAGDLARRAHDEGYAPRYMNLVDLAGPIGKGGKWVPQPKHGARRRAADILGFRVAVDWDIAQQHALVVTAMRLRSIVESADTRSAPLDAFDDFLEKCLARGSSRVSRSTPTSPHQQRGSHHE